MSEWKCILGEALHQCAPPMSLVRLSHVTLLFCVLALMVIVSCGGNPYLEASLKSAELEGKSQQWFREQWGHPTSIAKRFFGGIQWTYVRIAGGTETLLFQNFDPHLCEITLDFDKKGKLEDYTYKDC